MHLALINIAKAKYEMDDPRMSGFVNNLDAVNKAAERSPGFVWRLVGNVTSSAISIHAFDDSSIIINMAVWESIEALEDYTYRTIHKRVFAGRNDWFERLDGPHMALWWVEPNTKPSVLQGQKKLKLLAKNGPTAKAFTFGSPFTADGHPVTAD